MKLSHLSSSMRTPSHLFERRVVADRLVQYPDRHVLVHQLFGALVGVFDNVGHRGMHAVEELGVNVTTSLSLVLVGSFRVEQVVEDDAPRLVSLT